MNLLLNVKYLAFKMELSELFLYMHYQLFCVFPKKKETLLCLNSIDSFRVKGIEKSKTCKKSC